MPILNQHWYNRNEGNAYPVDEAVSSVDDNGIRLPSTILADLNLRWPEELGKYAFISAVSVTRGMVTIAIQASHDPLTVIDCVPLGIVSVARPITRYKNYAIEAQAPGVGGWVAFGSGADDTVPYTGRFSTPAQGRIAPRAARAYRSLPVSSLSVQNVLPALTGTVRLTGAKPLEVVKESREIRGINRDVIVVRLVQPDETGGQTNDTQVEQSIFHQYAGPCSGRPESHTCGDPQPIEFINSVGPDCDGVIHIVFSGCADISHISEPCGVLVDCNLGQVEACVNAYIPFPGGSLPGEYTPSASSVPNPPPESESGLSVSDHFLGGLPWTDCFLHGIAESFEVKSGLWLFDIGYDPHRPCLTSASSTSSTSSISSLSCFDVSVSGSATSASEDLGPCDCCDVWDQTLIDVTLSGFAPPNAALNGTYTLSPLQGNPCQWGSGALNVGTPNLLLTGIQLIYLHPVNNTFLPNVYLRFFGHVNGGVGTLTVYGADAMVCPGTTITTNTGLTSTGGFPTHVPVTTRVIGGCPGSGTENLARIRQKFATSRNDNAATYCTEWNGASWPVATKPGSTLVAIVLPVSIFVGFNIPPNWVFRAQIGSGNHYFSVYTIENAPSHTGLLDFRSGADPTPCYLQAVYLELENVLLANIIDITATNINQSGTPFITAQSGSGFLTHTADELALAIYSIKSPSSAISGYTNGYTQEIVSDALNNMSVQVTSKLLTTISDPSTEATGANPAVNLDGGGGLLTFRAITGTAPGHSHGHVVQHCTPYHHSGTSKHVGPLIDPLYTASSAASRNITVWDGFDDYTVHRRVVTDFQVQQGPVGALHNAGIVINYEVNPANLTQVIYYLVEVDADSQHILIRRWTGTNFVTLVSVFVPGIIVGNWYRLTVDTNSNHIGPTIVVHLEGYDNALNMTLGPVQASNWGTPNGRFGLFTDRSVTSYSFWHVEEL